MRNLNQLISRVPLTEFGRSLLVLIMVGSWTNHSRILNFQSMPPIHIFCCRDFLMQGDRYKSYTLSFCVSVSVIICFYSCTTRYLFWCDIFVAWHHALVICINLLLLDSTNLSDFSLFKTWVITLPSHSPWLWYIIICLNIFRFDSRRLIFKCFIIWNELIDFSFFNTRVFLCHSCRPWP